VEVADCDDLVGRNSLRPHQVPNMATGKGTSGMGLHGSRLHRLVRHKVVRFLTRLKVSLQGKPLFPDFLFSSLRSSFSLLASVDFPLFLKVVKVLMKWSVDDLSQLLVKTECSYALTHIQPKQVNTPPRGSPVQAYKPIGPVGSVSFGESYIRDATNWDSGLNKVRGNCIPKVTKVTEGIRSMIDEMSALKVVEPLPDGSDFEPLVNISIRPKPGGKKALVITDARHVIGMMGHEARSFGLPKVTELFDLNGSGDVCFCKIDVANAYHSVKLPGMWPDLFRFMLSSKVKGTRCWKWSSLPFGWHLSPHIFQHLMQDVLSGISSDCIRLIYLDDLLIAGSDPEQVRLAAQAVAKALTDKGFLLSSHKCVLEPASSITWLGKSICVRAGKVCIDTPCDVLAACVTSAALASAKLRPARLVQQTCGLVGWASGHHRLAYPWLQRAHLAVISNCKFLPSVASQHLSMACLLASRGADHRFFTAGSPPKFPYRYVVWVDAAEVCSRVGVVVFDLESLTSHVWSLPAPGMNQQLAELYSCKVGIGKAGLLGVASEVLLVSDSKSSLHTLLKLSCRARATDRGHVLRQVSVLLLRYQVAAHLAYVKSGLNPADIPSRWHLSGPCEFAFDVTSPLSSAVLKALANLEWSF